MFEAIQLISNIPWTIKFKLQSDQYYNSSKEKKHKYIKKKINIRLQNYLHNYKYNTVRTMCKKDYKQSIYK